VVSYLVDWGNGFVGGFTKDFDQEFNGPKRGVFDDLKCYGISDLKIITSRELDELRGFHKPTLQEYFCGVQGESRHDTD
jgi:hypothetical protein